MSDEWTVTPHAPGLNVRLHWWAISRGWRLKIGVERAGGRAFVTATVGVHTGRGRTSGEALNALGDVLAVVEGWPDDRRAAGKVAA